MRRITQLFQRAARNASRWTRCIDAPTQEPAPLRGAGSVDPGDRSWRSAAILRDHRPIAQIIRANPTAFCRELEFARLGKGIFAPALGPAEAGIDTCGSVADARIDARRA